MDESDLNDLMTIHRETVVGLHRMVARRTGDRSLAEDIVQETWMRAVAAWTGDGLPDDPPAWLRTVALNLIRNEARGHKPAQLDAAALDAWTREQTRAPEVTSTVRWGLAQLPPDRAHLLESFHLDGRSVRQLAAEHGTTEKAIERRLDRARRRLRTVLTPHVQRTAHVSRSMQ